jgi:hypothetical protein
MGMINKNRMQLYLGNLAIRLLGSILVIYKFKSIFKKHNKKIIKSTPFISSTKSINSK